MERFIRSILRMPSIWVSYFNPTFQALFKYSNQHLDSKKPEIDSSKETTKKHIDKAIDWLLYQQSLQPDGGVAARISFDYGKVKIESSYPEVTGYIITTFCDYYEIFGGDHVLKAAKKAADFELGLQLDDGSFPGSTIGHSTGSSVFNSAQIINGLVRIFEVTKDKKYLDSAARATDWIASVQDEDGSWTKWNYMQMKRVYDAKVDQSLLDVDKASGANKYKEVTEKNFDFIYSQQEENGWFNNCDNSRPMNHVPLTHTIGYTIEGLISCYAMNHDEKVLRACKKTADVLLEKFKKEDRLLSGRFNKDWEDSSATSCMTGDAQISMCWSKLYKVTGDEKYLNASYRMNDFLKSCQIKSEIKTIDGALTSSYPFWGEYNPYTINSWGVKYFADALILEYKNKK